MLGKELDKIPSNIEKQEDEKVIWEKGFDSVSRFVAKSGNVFLGTDKGLREENEDVLVWDKNSDAFVVVDGMGGYEKGGIAARIVAEEISHDFQKINTSPIDWHNQAKKRMKEEGIYNGGAAYLAGKIEKGGKKLSICSAGDCALVIIDSKGSVKFSSEISFLNDAPTGKSPGVPHITSGIEINNYDCIIAATDGLWDNIETKEIGEMMSDKKIEEGFLNLVELAKKRMVDGGETKNGTLLGNKDNLTIFLYQIMPVPLRGK